MSNLFNPDEPLASYFANNDLMNQKLSLELETANDASGVGLDPPTLFELADIDEDDGFSNPGPAVSTKSNDETVSELIDLVSLF